MPKFAIMNTETENLQAARSRGARGAAALRVAILYSMLLFAAAWSVWGLCTPLLGDDLVAAFRSHDLGRSLLTVPRYAWGVWNHCNARTGDMLAPMWLYLLPRAVSALLLGVAVFAAIWGMMRLGLAGRRAPWATVLTTVLIYVCLPWWDMDFYVCHFNYVWGAAFGTLALMPLLEGGLHSPRWLWCLPLVFVAVATHEALGFPLGGGLVAYWWCNRRRIHLTVVRKWWVGAMLAGALFCVSSPASYQRVGIEAEPDLPVWGLLVQTVPLSVLLAARALWLAWRGRLGRLLRSRWVIFAVASLLSACFTLVGGIEGRGGWYAQMFAIMALAYDFSGLEQGRMMSGARLRRIPLVLALLCNCYVVVFGLRLMEMSGERRAALSLWRMSGASELRTVAVENLRNPWVATCMPLTSGGVIDTPDFYYSPRPLAPDEKNPADPVIGL